MRRIVKYVLESPNLAELKQYYLRSMGRISTLVPYVSRYKSLMSTDPPPHQGGREEGLSGSIMRKEAHDSCKRKHQRIGRGVS